MKILADENLPGAVVAWLRANGHDVLFATEAQAGAPDTDWAVRAEREKRILLTADKDFGELVFRDGLASHGLVLLRLDEVTAPEILARLQMVWSVVEANPSGQFIVITE